MTEPKTRVTNESVEDFLRSIENKTRQKDAFELLAIYQQVTGLPARMWGSSIVGFGVCHINGTEWPIAAFSPRKQNLTLYIYPKDFPQLLQRLGKHKTSVSCLYINQLADVDSKLVKQLVAASYKRDKTKYQ